MAASARAKKLGRVIEHEGDITAGELKANDAYDLTLIEKPDGNYVLFLFMKLQFFFEDGGMTRWTLPKKQQFIAYWEATVRSVWDNLAIKTLPSHKVVSLSLDFEAQIGGFMFDHWEITVQKIVPGTAFRSYVNPRLGNVRLTDQDNAVTVRTVRGAGNFRMRTTAHEFGHMLGLDDEYGPLFGGVKGKHNKDHASIMNIGETVRRRHKNYLMIWLDTALKEHGIK